MKKTLAALICLCMLFTFAACASKDIGTDKADDTDKTAETSGTVTADPDDMTVTHIATIEMEDGGVIKLELYGNMAPISVGNFVSLASDGFYDGLLWHRVVPDFVIQSGDPEGTGMGGSDRTIKGEFAANGVENNLSHEKGVISMARESTGYDTASSQFFICLDDVASLDGQYAAFGRVIEGMDVVEEIGQQPTDSDSKPVVDQVIKTITIEEK